MIVPYDPFWKIEFEQLHALLCKEFSGLEIDIQHVGSTSVPGAIAKPLLDIDIIISNKNLLAVITSKLVSLGYIAKGEQGVTGRYAFRQSSALVPSSPQKREWLTHHLYVCYANSLALKNHLLFRDSLLKDNELVKKYNKLKEELVNNGNISRERYTKMKTDFMLEVLADGGLSKEELNEIRQANI